MNVSYSLELPAIVDYRRRTAFGQARSCLIFSSVPASEVSNSVTGKLSLVQLTDGLGGANADIAPRTFA